MTSELGLFWKTLTLNLLAFYKIEKEDLLNLLCLKGFHLV